MVCAVEAVIMMILLVAVAILEITEVAIILSAAVDVRFIVIKSLSLNQFQQLYF